ncbi:MAG: hypothetical protein DWH79_09135 [Planctomycetota bacterium]|nr:MAG: hypothetical protein DWH79_09135 [Planctomycetota bacterium]
MIPFEESLELVRSSGLKTFRGADGLWRGYRPEEVACPEAWRRNPGLVLDFYNKQGWLCRRTAEGMATTRSDGSGRRVRRSPPCSSPGSFPGCCRASPFYGRSS